MFIRKRLHPQFIVCSLIFLVSLLHIGCESNQLMVKFHERIRELEEENDSLEKRFNILVGAELHEKVQKLEEENESYTEQIKFLVELNVHTKIQELEEENEALKQQIIFLKESRDRSRGNGNGTR